MHCWALEV
jgi:hypothetical protein